MVIANGLKRTLALPLLVGGLALATISYGYVATHQPSPVVPSQHQVVEMRPAPEQNLETIVTVTPVAVAPQIIEKPATLQEIGGIEGITEEYIVRVAKWVGQELGYPMDPGVKINFLTPEDYAEQIKKTPGGHLVANSIGFISPDRLNIYIKEAVHPSRLVGLVLNETAKSYIGILEKQNKLKKQGTVLNEAEAFAYQIMAQRVAEDSLGFEGIFTPPTYFERVDLEHSLFNLKKLYEENNNLTAAGFSVLIYTLFNEPQFNDVAESVKKGNKITSQDARNLFAFLLEKDEAYANTAIYKVGEKEFGWVVDSMMARRGTALVLPWNPYDNRLP